VKDTDRQTSGRECTTTESFGDHGIDDGVELVHSTYYRLMSGGRETFEPTTAFYDSLESAFIWAYLGSVDEAGVPDHVEAAIDDARAFTANEFAERPDADLRTAVVPTFYQQVAEFHCAYRS